MATPHTEPKARKPQTPSAHWRKVMDDMAAVVQRSVEQRAARDRERRDSTDYHRAADHTSETGSA